MPTHTVEERRIQELVDEGLSRQQAEELLRGEQLEGDVFPGIGRRRTPGVPAAAVQDILEAGGEPGDPSVPLTEPAAAGPALPEGEGKQTGLRLLELLGGIGGNIAKSRAIGKADKSTQQRQARANLVNALKRRPSARVQRSRPKMGMLGTLAQGFGGLGATLRQGQGVEAVDEQKGFENVLAERRAGAAEKSADAAWLRARQAGAADRPTAARNKEAFLQKGIKAFREGRSRRELDALIQSDPDFQSIVQRNPDAAAELMGNAEKGFTAAEEGTADRLIDEARENRAKAEEERKITDQEIQIGKIALSGYTAALEGAVDRSVQQANPVIESPDQFLEETGVAKMHKDLLPAFIGQYRKHAGMWYRKRHEFLEKEREEHRAEEKIAMAQERETFDRMESLRKSLQNLPGVKAFSGLQGIGAAFSRLNESFRDYQLNPDAHRAAYQAAIINQFQRLIDPATVRKNDIDLLVDAQSMWAQFKTAIIRVGAGGFVDDKLLKGMMQVAQKLHKAQRGFVESEVDGAIVVWNILHKTNPIAPNESELIVDSILGGEGGEQEESAVGRLERLQ